MKVQRLLNQSKDRAEIASSLVEADTFFSRLKGLIGTTEMKKSSALLFRSCRSIHTFFMSIPIDVVFVDEQMTVKKIYKNLPPWRLTSVVLTANSAIELPAGTIDASPVAIGDQLYVGD